MAIIGRHGALAAAVWVAGTAVWLGAIAAGTRVLVGHASTPGPVVRAAVQFPEDSGISRQTSRATLIIFAHPECPCTRATLGELSGLLAEVPSAPSVHVLFMQRDRASAATDTAARPGLILLDLNMPRKSGLEALREIKADPNLRSIPVVVLTTSKADEDILRSYDLGVNSFIVNRQRSNRWPPSSKILAAIGSKSSSCRAGMDYSALADNSPPLRVLVVDDDEDDFVLIRQLCTTFQEDATKCAGPPPTPPHCTRSPTSTTTST